MASGAAGKCEPQALTDAGSNSTGAHQCRFVQGLFGAPGVPASVGMCVPSPLWADCTTLDYDGILAAINGAANAQDAFDTFCFGVTSPDANDPVLPVCEGLGFGCLSFATEQAIFDLLVP